MDTDNPMNNLAILEIKHQVFSSSILEAFLESAPQFIFQFPIVIILTQQKFIFEAKNAMGKNIILLTVLKNP